MRVLFALALLFVSGPTAIAQANFYTVSFPGIKPGPGSFFIAFTQLDLLDLANGIKLPLVKQGKAITGDPVFTYQAIAKSGFPVTLTVGANVPLQVYVGILVIPNKAAAGVNGTWNSQGKWNNGGVFQVADPAPLDIWITNWPKTITVK